MRACVQEREERDRRERGERSRRERKERDRRERERERETGERECIDVLQTIFVEWDFTINFVIQQVAMVQLEKTKKKFLTISELH